MVRLYLFEMPENFPPDVHLIHEITTSWILKIIILKNTTIIL